MWCATLVLLDVIGSGCGAHNHYQPHPAEPAQHTTCSNIRLVLLKMGIMMPEICWKIVKNKHLTVASCWFSLSLHNLLTMHGHRNLKKGKTLGESFIFSPRNPACVHNQQCTKFWKFIWYLKVTNASITAQARQKGLLHIFFSDVVSKLEDDETVTAKILSRDEAICPGMLTDRTFEPGGEKYMQELKLGGGGWWKFQSQHRQRCGVMLTRRAGGTPHVDFQNTIPITKQDGTPSPLRFTLQFGRDIWIPKFSC